MIDGHKRKIGEGVLFGLANGFILISASFYGKKDLFMCFGVGVVLCLYS